MSEGGAWITGRGALTPFGGLAPTWQRLCAGDSAIAPIRHFDASGFPTRIAAQVAEQELPEIVEGGFQWNDRLLRFAVAAADQAIAEAGLAQGTPRPHRWGVVAAFGLGFHHHAEIFGACSGAAQSSAFDANRFRQALRDTLQPFASDRLSPGNLTTRLARRYGLLGRVTCVDTACAAGAHAVGMGLDWIRRGHVDGVLVVGADSMITPLGLASFCLLRALSRRNDDPQRASCPFDARRDGFVLGEGAGALVLERPRAAHARGATAAITIRGFGSACDAYRATDPHPEGIGARLAMERALADAELAPEQIGYCNAHGTSTPANDRIESHAIEQVFAAAPPPTSSTKSMIGHLTEAAGAVETIVTALALEHALLPPTMNYAEPDPDCRLDYVANEARAADLDWAISNSFGFGGQCATVLLGRVDS